ncbi:MAG: thioredoxin family protein [Proteobacteria bacterium]|nr:thioredoxin family protein [Pseudomonadota bacterium]
MKLLPLLLLACAEPPTTARPAQVIATPPAPVTEKAESHWVERTDLELDDALKSVCRDSVEDGKPILLEFSAPWCVDCRKLNELSTDDAVKAELEQFHHLTVDVGKWDRHKPLIAAFEVSALAWWVAMKPTNCGHAITKWPRLKEGGFEPASSPTGVRTAEGVATWLAEARNGA